MKKSSDERKGSSIKSPTQNNYFDDSGIYDSDSIEKERGGSSTSMIQRKSQEDEDPAAYANQLMKKYDFLNTSIDDSSDNESNSDIEMLFEDL